MRSRVFGLVSACRTGFGGGVDGCDAGYALTRVISRRRAEKKEKREKKEKKEKRENSKIVPRGPGRPRGESSISLVIGTPQSKRITLGDPGYPEGITRVQGIPT